MKAILIGDTHHGENNNSDKTNEDLLEFYRFVVKESKKRKIKKLCHLGDFFHQRDKLDIKTIKYGIQGAEILNERFSGIYHDRPELILGNHDLYYKNSREIHSSEILNDHFDVIEHPFIEENVMFSPWVTDEQDWDDLIDLYNDHNPDFVLGHFEFSRFRLNQNYVMEHGYSHKKFKRAKKVFTGHYHTRQEMDNVVYIGSPIPFNFNDANDPERGFCILDLETGEHEFVNFKKSQFLSIDHESFLNEDFDVPEDVSVRVEIAGDCDDKTMDAIKEKLESTSFRNSKIQYTPSRYKEIVESVNDGEVSDIENIDGSVIKYLQESSETEGIDNELLVELYNKAIENDNI